MIVTPGALRIACEGTLFLAAVAAFVATMRRRGRFGLGCFAAAGFVGWPPVIPELAVAQVVLVALLAVLGLAVGVAATFRRRRTWIPRCLWSLGWVLLTFLVVCSVLWAQITWDGFMWQERIPELALYSADGAVAIYVYERSEFPDPIVWTELCERWGLWRIELGTGPGFYASDLFDLSPPAHMGSHLVKMSRDHGRGRVWIDGVEGSIGDLSPRRDVD